MNRLNTTSSEEVFMLIEMGVWMRSGGYTWRNHKGYGQYLAHGKYPECIRACDKHTLESIQSMEKRREKVYGSSIVGAWEQYVPFAASFMAN